MVGHLGAQLKIGSGNTTAPDNVLEVEGSITVRDKIYAGGDDNTLGNPGKAGQVLVSQGEGLPPRWRTLNLPIIEENFFYLIYNNSFTDYTDDGNEDNEGLSLGSSTSGNNGPYTEGTARDNAMFSGFQSISGLTKTFDVFSSDNKVYVTFEAVAHIGSSALNAGVDFSCGIFVGGATQSSRTLRGIRRVTLQQADTAQYPFITFTQIALADELGVGSHTVEVACKRNANYNYTGNLGIGRAIQENINNFVAKTSLKVEVYEAPQTFHDIIED